MSEYRIVRHPNGHLMVEECPLPTKEDFETAFRSISKAWPVLAEHAPHIDGEFDNAVSSLRRMTERLLNAIPGDLPPVSSDCFAGTNTAAATPGDTATQKER